MSVSGPGNCTFLKIYWAGKHQKGAISGPGNLQKGREILYPKKDPPVDLVECVRETDDIARVGNSEYLEMDNIVTSCPLTTSMGRQSTPLEFREEITSLTGSKGEDRLYQGSGKDNLMEKSSVIYNRSVRFIKLIDLCFRTLNTQARTEDETFSAEKYATDNLVTLGSIGEMVVTLASLWNGDQVANVGNDKESPEAQVVVAIAITVLYLKARREKLLESLEPDWDVPQEVVLVNCKRNHLSTTNPAVMDDRPIVNTAALALSCWLFYQNFQVELEIQKAQVSRVCVDRANYQYENGLNPSEGFLQNSVVNYDEQEQEQMDLPWLRKTFISRVGLEKLSDTGFLTASRKCFLVSFMTGRLHTGMVCEKTSYLSDFTLLLEECLIYFFKKGEEFEEKPADLSKVDFVKPMVEKIQQVCTKLQTKNLNGSVKKVPDKPETQKLLQPESPFKSPSNPHIDLKDELTNRVKGVRDCEFGVWDRGKGKMFNKAECGLGELCEELAWEEKDGEIWDTGEFWGNSSVDSAFAAV